MTDHATPENAHPNTMSPAASPESSHFCPHCGTPHNAATTPSSENSPDAGSGNRDTTDPTPAGEHGDSARACMPDSPGPEHGDESAAAPSAAPAPPVNADETDDKRRTGSAQVTQLALELTRPGTHHPPVTVPLAEGQTSIGKSQSCDLTLTEAPYVSRHHCVIDVNGGGVRVEDNGSRNGVFLKLHGAQTIELGQVFMLGRVAVRLIEAPDTRHAPES